MECSSQRVDVDVEKLCIEGKIAGKLVAISGQNLFSGWQGFSLLAVTWHRSQSVSLTHSVTYLLTYLLTGGI